MKSTEKLKQQKDFIMHFLFKQKCVNNQCETYESIFKIDSADISKF
jgi:hypothetical protein